MDDNTALLLMMLIFGIINIAIVVSENWRNK